MGTASVAFKIFMQKQVTFMLQIFQYSVHICLSKEIFPSKESDTKILQHIYFAY